jgi:hypothetical protein
MGLHKADFIFHSRPPPHYAENPRSPSFTSNHSVCRLFTAQSRLSSLGNSVASAPFTTADYVQRLPLVMQPRVLGGCYIGSFQLYPREGLINR